MLELVYTKGFDMSDIGVIEQAHMEAEEHAKECNDPECPECCFWEICDC